MKLQSNKVAVNATPEQVFTFLSDATNLIHILPQDKISDWKATSEGCSFKVQGGITISLLENGMSAEKGELYMKSGEKSPFPFNLTIHSAPIDGGTEGHISFDGEVNMFLKMMVEKPLLNLFNYMSDKLQEYFKG